MADEYRAREIERGDSDYPGWEYEGYTVSRWNPDTGDAQFYTVRLFDNGNIWIRNQISRQTIDRGGRIGKKVLKAVEDKKAE